MTAYTCRVSEDVLEAIGFVSDGLQLVSDAKNGTSDRQGSDRRVVYRGLQLVLAYAEKDQPQLIANYNALLQAQINNGADLSSPQNGPSLAEQLRAEADAARYEVPTGAKGVGCDVDDEMDKQLQLVGRWTGRDKSELVRHGIFLVFDATRRKATSFEKKLAEDFEAGKKILNDIKKDPSFGNAKQRARKTSAKQPAQPPANPTAGKPRSKRSIKTGV